MPEAPELMVDLTSFGGMEAEDQPNGAPTVEVPGPLADLVISSLEEVLRQLTQAGWECIGPQADGKPVFLLSYAVNRKSFGNVVEAFKEIVQASALAGLYLELRAPRIDKHGRPLQGYMTCQVFGPCMTVLRVVTMGSPDELVSHEEPEPESEAQPKMSGSPFSRSPIKRECSCSPVAEYALSPFEPLVVSPLREGEEEAEAVVLPIPSLEDFQAVRAEPGAPASAGSSLLGPEDGELMVSLNETGEASLCEEDEEEDDDAGATGSEELPGEQIVWRGHRSRKQKALVERDGPSAACSELAAIWQVRADALGTISADADEEAPFSAELQAWNKKRAAAILQERQAEEARRQAEAEAAQQEAEAAERARLFECLVEQINEEAQEEEAFRAALSDDEEDDAAYWEGRCSGKGSRQGRQAHSLYGSSGCGRAHAGRGRGHNAGRGRWNGPPAIY